MTRGKSESLIAPQSSILLLLEGLLFTQNFMGCHNDIIFITVPRIYFEVCNGFAIINIRETFDLKNKLDKFIKLTY